MWGWSWRLGLSDAATASVEQPAHSLHGGDTAPDHVLERGAPPEDAIGIGKANPFIGERLAVENVESLEDSDQVGNAVHLVGIENLASRVLLHFEVRTVGHAAQQFAYLFAAQFPALRDVEQGFEAGCAEALALLFRTQVDNFRGRVAGNRVAKACHSFRRSITGLFILHFWRLVQGGS